MIHDNRFDQIRFINCEEHDEIMSEWRDIKHIENRFLLYHKWQELREWSLKREW